MEHAELYLVNVKFCAMYILSKWIQLQYGGKRFFNFGAFHVNQPNRMLGDMSLDGANYIQDFLELFFEIELYHARKMCLKEYFIHRLKNGMET
jgi:hypothetical protein